MSVTSDWRRRIDLQRISTVNALHSLGQLIQSVEDSKGWTLREVARRVERSGRTMSHAYVAKLKREPIRSVTYETIRALSVGLDLPERIVATATLESMGVHDIGTAEVGAAVAIARDPDLSERDRRILLAVVREMHGEHTNDDSTQVELNEAASQAAPPAGGRAVADPAQPDGVTSGAADYAGGIDTSLDRPGAGTNAYPRQRGSENQSPAADFGFPEPRRDDYERAAMTGTSELDRLDRDAAVRGEESQDHDGEDPA